MAGVFAIRLTLGLLKNQTMRLLLLLLMLANLSGCVTPSVIPPRDELIKIQRTHIVAVEPPPLAAPAYFGLSVVGWAASVPMLAPASGSQRDERITNLIQASVENKDAWLPTKVLAAEIQSQLSARHIRADVSPDLKRITGLKDRRTTLSMENWLAPLRDWYNNSAPILEYRSSGFEPLSSVLEVGILNYELTDQHLLLQVMVKVIDPSTGKLLGRVRAASRVPLANYDHVFANGGAEYKGTFAATSRELVRQCLTELGFIS